MLLGLIFHQQLGTSIAPTVLMFGPAILVRTVSKRSHPDRYGNRWQYHSRSDHHSKVASWGIIFDLLRESAHFRAHVEAGAVAFGINHEMRDFRQDRKKNLDLVICKPAAGMGQKTKTLAQMVGEYGIELDEREQDALGELPILLRKPVGSVLIAVEAKACMTAHQRALPRLYDELNSSHATVHGATDDAIAVGFVMVNAAERYLSPDLNKQNRALGPVWSKHNQPRDAQLAIEKVRQLPRRSRAGENGYDALAIIVVDFPNDGSEVSLVHDTPAPQKGAIYHYESMIHRLAHLYGTRFQHL